MIKIRTLKPEDIKMVSSWHIEEVGTEIEGWMLPPTTFIAELNDTPMLCLSLALTNCTGIAQMENLVGNPAFKAIRKECLEPLVHFVCDYAKMFGARRIYMNAYIDKLKDKYESLGFTKATETLSLLWKDI